MAVSRDPLVIDVVSDVVCPWSFIGKRRWERALELRPDVQVEIRWRPFRLDSTIPPGGIPRTEYMLRKFGSIEDVKELTRRIAVTGEDEGIAFAFDAIERSPDTTDAHRLIRWAHEADLQNETAEALFRAYFEEGRDVGDREVLADIAEATGLARSGVEARLESDMDLDTVAEEIAQADRIGIQGVPFFILAGRIGVSGAEAPEVMVKAIDAAVAEMHGTDG